VRESERVRVLDGAENGAETFGFPEIRGGRSALQ
jgi:hypothetical protein